MGGELWDFQKVGDIEVARIPAPSGPVVKPPLPSANTRDAYWAWRKTEDGKKVWHLIATTLEEAIRFGEKRISTKRLVEFARATLKREINNSYTAYMADEIVERWPHFAQFIERRKRKKV